MKNKSKGQKIITFCHFLSHSFNDSNDYKMIENSLWKLSEKLIHSKLLIRMRSFKMDRIMMKNCKKANSQFFLSFFFHFEEQFIFILFFYNCVEFYFYFFETKLRESWKKLFNLLEVEFWMGNLAVKARSWLWYLCGFLAPNYWAFVWSRWIEAFTPISLEISQIC